MGLRPAAESFLRLMEKFYEIVIFTAATEDYTEWAFSFFDKEAVSAISYKLCRQHISNLDKNKDYHIKDLSLIGRSLSNTLIIDNLSQNYQLQPENGIQIKEWYDDNNDMELMKLAPALIKIAESNIQDIRPQLQSLRTEM